MASTSSPLPAKSPSPAQETPGPEDLLDFGPDLPADARPRSSAATLTQKPPTRTRLYQIHSWTGFLLGLLSLLVFFSGSIAALAHELGAWGRRGAQFPSVLEAAGAVSGASTASATASTVATNSPTAGAATGGSSAPSPSFAPAVLNRVLDSLALQVDTAFRHDIGLGQELGGPLSLFFHAHESALDGKVVERGTRFFLDPVSARVLERRDGTDEEVYAPGPLEALSHFFIDLHIRLLIPNPAGSYATGIVGFGLMLLLLTGFVINRKRRRDAKRARPSDAVGTVSRRLALRSLHTRVGLLILPYAAIVSFTGAFFGFGSALLLPALAKVAFGGNELKMYETLVGHEPDAGKPAPFQVLDLSGILADAAGRMPGSHLRYGVVSHYGHEGSRVELALSPREGSIRAATLRYEGSTGKYLGEKPALGTIPSFGATLFSLMGPLHFGDFAGAFSKLLWAFLGLGCCVLTVSGLLIRGERRPGPLKKIVTGVAAALPLSTFLAIAVWALASTGLPGREMPGMALAFFAPLLLGPLLCFRLPSPRRAALFLLLAGGVLALLLPFLTGALRGFSPFAAFRAAEWHTFAVDMGFLAAGFALLVAARSFSRVKAAIS